MRWFRRSPFPADMLERLDRLARFELDHHGSGIDPSEVWSSCVAPFLTAVKSDRDGFLAALYELVADQPGGFAKFGAARLAWELLGGECLNIEAALPLIDAGIDFKRARNLSSMSLTGYEQQRIDERKTTTVSGRPPPRAS